MWRLWSRTERNSLRQCMTPSGPDRSPRQDGQTRSVSVYLLTHTAQELKPLIAVCGDVQCAIYICNDFFPSTIQGLILEHVFVGPAVCSVVLPAGRK